jgi:hypothetical protein
MQTHTAEDAMVLPGAFRLGGPARVLCGLETSTTRWPLARRRLRSQARCGTPGDHGFPRGGKPVPPRTRADFSRAVPLQDHLSRGRKRGRDRERLASPARNPATEESPGLIHLRRNTPAEIRGALGNTCPSGANAALGLPFPAVRKPMWPCLFGTDLALPARQRGRVSVRPFRGKDAGSFSVPAPDTFRPPARGEGKGHTP